MTRAFRDEVLAAEPGHPHHVPHPYPKTTEQMVENFRSAYFGHLHETEEQVSADELEVYRQLEKRRYTVVVLRVENWEIDRCMGRRPAPYYHLLRYLHPETGEELLRTTQHESGHTGVISGVYPGTVPVPALDELPAILDEMGQGQRTVRDAQFVSSNGFPWRCVPHAPCIAFRSGDKIRVLSRDRQRGDYLLYEISPDSRRLTALEHRDQMRAQGLRPLGDRGEDRPLVSIGFDFAEAELVARTTDLSKQ